MSRYRAVFLWMLLALIFAFMVSGMIIYSAQIFHSEKDGIVQIMQSIAIDACRYRSRLRYMHGGDGTYAGYELPSGLRNSETGTFMVSHDGGQLVIICSTAAGDGSIRAIVDDDGILKVIDLEGKFNVTQ